METTTQAIAHMVDNGQHEPALLAMEQLLAQYPDNARLHNEMATLAYDLAETEKALSHFQRAAALEPENKAYLKNLADYYYVVEKDVENALAHYEQVLKVDPNHIDALTLAGHLSVSQHRYAQGRQYYQRALELDPRNKELHRILERTRQEAPDHSGHSQPDQRSNQAPAGSPLQGNQMDTLEFLNRISDNQKEASHIEGWLMPPEAFILYSMSRQHDDTAGDILEIGSFLGKSSYWLAKGAQERNGEKVICVDTFQGSTEHQDMLKGRTTYDLFEENLRKAGVFDWVTPVQKSSEAAFTSYRGRIGLLFIDGSHAYPDVKADLLSWEQFLIPGGIVILHDSTGQWDGPTQVADELIIGRKDMYKDVIRIASMTIARKMV